MSEGSNDNNSQLIELCESESLSEEGLREIIERHGLTQHNNQHISDYKFFRAACRNERVTEGIIQCLLEYSPDAASAVSENGWSPLHNACGNKNMTKGIVQLLVYAAPASVRSLTNYGDMPLHILCDNKKVGGAAAIQILKFLIEKCPESVRHADCEGRLPIHFAAGKRSPEFCRVLIEAYPGSEQITAASGVLPLLHACANNSLAAVEYLYRQYPDAINYACTDGYYPIHHAIGGMQQKDNPAATVEIVRFLLNCDPNQKLIQFQGMSLLHFACGQQYNDSKIEASIQVIKVIFDAVPDSVRSVDNEGHVPLHILCRNSKLDGATAMQILNFLLEKYPEAVQHADNNGILPIHNAAGTRSPEFCRLIIEAYPGSERMTNTNGILPLHWACGKNSLPTVEYLYSVYREAIHHVVTPGGFYPIHPAIQGVKHRENPAAAVEIVQFLLDCDPDQKLKQFQGASLLRFACTQQYNDSNIEAAIQIIKILFDAHPEAIEDNRIATDIQRYHQRVQAFINGELVYSRQANDHRLMMTPDDNGRLPLHRALRNNVRLGSIKLLVKGNPSALQTVERNLAMPLHVACQHHNSASVVQYLLSLSATILDAVDRQWNTVLHYACRGAKHDTIALLLEKYDAASVSKRNAHGKLPIDMLWESNAVNDRESVEYMGSIFQLVRANPEMVVISNSINQPVDADAPSNGKKRKFSHDHEE